MKIGEFPHREFSYCFLSDMPKCEAGHTPTGVAAMLSRSHLGWQRPKRANRPKRQSVQPQGSQASPSGVAAPLSLGRISGGKGPKGQTGPKGYAECKAGYTPTGVLFR